MPSSSSSIYSYKPGGALKFKGGEPLPSSSKKKKKKSKIKSSTSRDIRHDENYASSSRERIESEEIVNENLDEREEEDGNEEDRQKKKKSTRIMTESERKFEEVRLKRMADRVAKEANLSHKDRVDQFNKNLADRTEHNDMLTVAGH